MSDFDNRWIEIFRQECRDCQVDPDSVALAACIEALNREIRKEFTNFTETQIHRKAYERASQEAAARRSGKAGSLVQFTEPLGGIPVVNRELAEEAEELARAEKITYGEALERLSR